MLIMDEENFGKAVNPQQKWRLLTYLPYIKLYEFGYDHVYCYIDYVTTGLGFEQKSFVPKIHWIGI
jgi:hypothetical protein